MKFKFTDLERETAASGHAATALTVHARHHFPLWKCVGHTALDGVLYRRANINVKMNIQTFAKKTTQIVSVYQKCIEVKYKTLNSTVTSGANATRGTAIVPE